MFSISIDMKSFITPFLLFDGVVRQYWDRHIGRHGTQDCCAMTFRFPILYPIESRNFI